MKSTHHTAWAYILGTVLTLAMVTGTAALMAAFAMVGTQPTEFSQVLLEPPALALVKMP